MLFDIIILQLIQGLTNVPSNREMNVLLHIRFRELKNNKLFLRMLIYFASLLIPIILVGVVTFQYSTNVMKRDFSNSIRQNLNSSAGTIEIYMKTAQETSINFFQNDTIQQLLIPYDQVNAEHRTQWHHIPRIIRSSQNIVNEYINSMFVYLDYQKVYTGEGIEDYKYFFEYNQFASYNSAFWKQLLYEEQYAQVLPPSRLSNTAMNASEDVIPIVTTNRVGTANAAMIINVSMDTLKDTLQNNSIFSSTEFIVVNDRNQIVLSSQPTLDRSTVQAIHRENANDAYRELSINGQRMLVMHTESDHLGWTYYALTPTNEFNKHAREILIMTLVTCMILILCGIVLSLVFSLNLYNPIRTIRNILMEAQDRGHSRGSNMENEFDFINKRIAYLVDDSQSYRSKFERTSLEYLDNSFTQLVKGNSIEVEESFNLLLKDPIGFRYSSLLCCNVLFEFTDEFYLEILDTDRLLIQDKLKRILWVLLEHQAPVYVLEYQKHLFVCIVNLANTVDLKLLEQGIEEIARCFEYDYRYCRIAFGIGNLYEDKKDLSHSFNEAMTALDHRDLSQKFQTIRAQDLDIRYTLHMTYNFETRIMNCLKSNDEANLTRLLQEIVEENRSKQVSHSDMNRLFRELYHVGIRYVAEQGLDIGEFVREENDWNDTLQQEERLDNLTRFYQQIMVRIRMPAGEEQGSIVSLILDYIHQKYRQDIYLEKIASEMGVSASYISRVFKQKTGTNLTDYVSRVRMEEAKRLLLETNLTIEDVGNQVGIPSRTTFIRIFKKNEGTTPSNFRTIGH